MSDIVAQKFELLCRPDIGYIRLLQQVAASGGAFGNHCLC